MEKNFSAITVKSEHARVLKGFNIPQKQASSHEKTIYVSVETYNSIGLI